MKKLIKVYEAVYAGDILKLFKLLIDVDDIKQLIPITPDNQEYIEAISTSSFESSSACRNAIDKNNIKTLIRCQNDRIFFSKMTTSEMLNKHVTHIEEVTRAELLDIE